MATKELARCHVAPPLPGSNCFVFQFCDSDVLREVGFSCQQPGCECKQGAIPVVPIRKPQGHEFNRGSGLAILRKFISLTAESCLDVTACVLSHNLPRYSYSCSSNSSQRLASFAFMNCSYSMSAAPDTAPRGSRRSRVSSWRSSRTCKTQEACLEWCLQRLRCLHTRCGSRRRKSQQRPPYGPKGVTLSSMQGAHQLSTQLAAKSHAGDRLKHACAYRAPFWYVLSVSLFLDQASPRPTPLSRLPSSACN